MDIKAKVKDTIVKLLKVKPEELKDGMSLQDSIGVDSTEMVELVLSLEKDFGTKLSAKEITKFCNLDDIEKNIASKLK